MLDNIPRACTEGTMWCISKKIFCFYMSYPDDIFDKWSLIIMISLYGAYCQRCVRTNLDIIMATTTAQTISHIARSYTHTLYNIFNAHITPPRPRHITLSVNTKTFYKMGFVKLRMEVNGTVSADTRIEFRKV